MNLKNPLLLLLSLLYISTSAFSQGAASKKTKPAPKPLPTFLFENKGPTVLYRTDKDQTVELSIKYTPVIKDTTVYRVVINAIQDGSDTAYFKMNPSPWNLTFGQGYSDNYSVKVVLKAGTNIKVPGLIKLSIHAFRDSIVDSHNIIYEPSESSKNGSEEKLIKSNDDLKADLSSLKSQLLNGDTSQTYIGKLITYNNVYVLPHQADNVIENKDCLDDLISVAMKNSNNMNRNIVTIKTDSTHSYKATQKEIDSVVVNISEGIIDYLRVKMTDGSYYENTKAPIPILTIRRRFDDKLINTQDDSFLFVKDVINFIADQRFNYFPSDGVIYLTNNKDHKRSEQKLFANSGLNSFVDFRIFTDLLGALDHQPNGLLQIEAKSKIYLHRSNIRNSFMYIFYGLEPYLGISKLDSKYDTVKLAGGSTNINRMDLYQRSFLNVGLKLNIFRCDFRPSNSIYLNAGYQFNSSNISIKGQPNAADSTNSKAIFHTPYFEAGISSKRIQGFGFEGGAKYMFQLLNKNNYISNSGYRRLMDFGVTAFYFASKKARDKFFVRFSNVLAFRDRQDDFYQLQFGYSLNVKI